jgi:hypothetical protein
MPVDPELQKNAKKIGRERRHVVGTCGPPSDIRDSGK